jgi:hypothetical protein
MLNLKTIGRYFDDDLVINAGCGLCANCDPVKADRRRRHVTRNVVERISI